MGFLHPSYVGCFLACSSCFSCVYSVLLKTHQNCAGYAGHFVMAQLLPSNLKDYDVLLAAQLGNISAADATTAQTIATTAATLLLQNRSALLLMPCTYVSSKSSLSPLSPTSGCSVTLAD